MESKLSKSDFAGPSIDSISQGTKDRARQAELDYLKTREVLRRKYSEHPSYYAQALHYEYESMMEDVHTRKDNMRESIDDLLREIPNLHNASIAVLHIEPGDALIFKTDSHIKQERGEVLKRALQSIFPQNKIIILTDANWEVSVARSENSAEFEETTKGE